MRLWHKDLIPVLPDKWLVAQWRELSAISGKLIKHGSPQHALVNKITQYERQHFAEYTYQVYLELKKRSKHIKDTVYEKILGESKRAFDKFTNLQYKYENWEQTFYAWHNNRYLKQCFYNLQEKYDCGLLTHSEYLLIKQRTELVLKSCV